MTVARKFSQIAPSGAVPALTDQVVGLGGGASDFLYSFQQVGLAIAPGPPAGGNLNFYVATTGNDANPGTVGSPFRTIQRGLTVAAQYNYQGLYFPTINVADGGYGEDLTVPIFFNTIGGGYAVLQGNHTTPGNVTLNSISQTGAISFAVDGVQLNAAGSTSTCWTISGGTANPRQINLNPPALGDGFVVQQAGVLRQDYPNTNVTKWLQTATADSFAIITGNSSAQFTGGAGSAVNFPGGGTSFFNFIQISDGSQLFWDYIAQTGGAVTGRALLSNGPVSITTSSGVPTDLPGDGTWAPNTGALISATDHGWRGWASRQFASYPVIEVPSNCWSFMNSGGFTGPRGFYYDDGTGSPSSVYFLPCVDFINRQTASYTAGYADMGTRIETDSAGAVTITVDTDANMSSGGKAVGVGSRFKVTNLNVGVTTIAGAGGVTVHNAGTVAQWATAVVYKRGGNEWVQTSV